MDFWSVTQSLLQGFEVTCLIFIITLIFSLPLGLIIAFGSMSKFPPLKFLVRVIVWIVRGFRRGGPAGISRRVGGQNPTKIATGKPKTTFKDVAGIDSEKQETIIKLNNKEDRFYPFFIINE